MRELVTARRSWFEEGDKKNIALGYRTESIARYILKEAPSDQKHRENEMLLCGSHGSFSEKAS